VFVHRLARAFDAPDHSQGRVASALLCRAFVAWKAFVGGARRESRCNRIISARQATLPERGHDEADA
jgi:hypothetical protein